MSKAEGWYTAVALNAFTVGTDAIFAAIASARSSPTGTIERVEAECREAPTNWRE